MDSFKIYTIDEGYLERLKEIEPKVPCEHYDKNQRPFIGIIITSNDVRYKYSRKTHSLGWVDARLQ